MDRNTKLVLGAFSAALLVHSYMMRKMWKDNIFMMESMVECMDVTIKIIDFETQKLVDEEFQEIVDDFDE